MKTFKDFAIRRHKLNEDAPATPSPAQQSQQQQPAQAPSPAPAPQQQTAPAPQTQPASGSIRSSLADTIRPQVDVAKAVIEGIYKAFQNDCGKVTKYDTMGQQIKDFESQIRGACKNVMQAVQNAKFDWHNWDNCSPKSFAQITLYKDRDLDALKLCAAVIVFYNSLTGSN